MKIVLGIDPGRNMGYALVGERPSGGYTLFWHKLDKDRPRLGFDKRLCSLREFLCDTVDGLGDIEIAIEDVYVSTGAKKNYRANLRLAQIVGMIKSTLYSQDMEFFEYAPATIKKSVAKGNASKEQVQRVCRLMFDLHGQKISEHEFDAMAIAICHINNRKAKMLGLKA